MGTSLKNCPCVSRLPSHQVLSSCTIHACVEAAQPCVYTPKTQPSHGILQVRDCDSLWLTVADFLLTFPTSLSSSMPFSHIDTFHAPCSKPDNVDADCLCPHAHAPAHAPFAWAFVYARARVLLLPFPFAVVCVFFNLFFLQKFLSVRRVTTCPPLLFYFIIFFASPDLSIHLLLPARRPHPLVVPRPRSVSIRYVVLPVATPPLLTASYSNSTLWPHV